jgi:predicted PurR-regulated permease PerM
MLWWIITGVLAAILLLLLYSFIGTFVFGVFVYYAARPLYRRLRVKIESRGVAAAAALFAFELPFLAVTGYLLLLAIRELERYAGAGAGLIAWFLPIPPGEIEEAIADPVAYVASFNLSTLTDVITTGEEVLMPVATFALHLSLAVAMAFYLLKDGHRVAAWFQREVGEDSSLRLYAWLVDRDLQVAYYGNIRTVVAVAMLAIVIYNGLNLIAPRGLTIPIPNVLALLTGVATIVPIVVGKIVYVPLAVYLGSIAVDIDPSTLWFPILVALVALVVLDVLPITVIRPYLAGESTHRGLMMFSYIFGGLLFGWYGVFLGPLVLVATIHLLRVGFSELAHGDQITAAVTTAPQLGSLPPPEKQVAENTSSAPDE